MSTSELENIQATYCSESVQGHHCSEAVHSVD
eukprot:CAMPEP_0116929636 /NCGR_PEP_ID=MMETSP0467-20121206/26695_1 /TAXON_ID=283647 /ORGANISM="Mesodinium pulex, Strain SPMC105" /LENGTH=31 /DNA_ID= /DNA_START= /DNA_END= /DNA_ORIENTATION=